jgi:hypothetical protein
MPPAGLMATLGLLQLGHETTPELAAAVRRGAAGLGLAAAPFRRWARAGHLLACRCWPAAARRHGRC